jgi:hypothetical protein
MIDYATILFTKYVGSSWTLNGDNYEGLNWLSKTPKPTKATLDGLWDEVLAELRAKKAAEAAAKTAAQAKLAALGLTVEDLQALGL